MKAFISQPLRCISRSFIGAAPLPRRSLTPLHRVSSLQPRQRLHTSTHTLRTHRHVDDDSAAAAAAAKTATHASEMSSLDVLGNIPVPASAVQICTARGFKLQNGRATQDGDAVMMFDDKVVRWRPWEHESMGGRMRILNARGQLDLPAEVFGVFEVLEPRPEMIIIGTGPQIAPMSPAMRAVFTKLNMRVDVLDTRNAAAQYNLLATERGTDIIAAALFPMGWKEGEGAATA